MDAMEKIVEALRSANKKCKARKTCQECKQYGNGLNCVYLLMAEELISNGVTVQEWISVKDRLPDTEDVFLCWSKELADMMFCYTSDFKQMEVTNWMPMPQPPKGD